MRKVSSLEAALTALSLTTTSERLKLAFAAFATVALLALAAAFAVSGGENLGAHIWKKGWICGESVKGQPTCRRDPSVPAP